MVGLKAILSLLLTVLMVGMPVHAEVLSVPTITPIAEATTLSSADLQAYASSTAQNASLDPIKFTKVIGCESLWDSSAVGDSGSSIGLVQIHLPAHPDITKEEALDPLFSIQWMAIQWKLGRQNAWSCYKIEERNGWR